MTKVLISESPIIMMRHDDRRFLIYQSTNIAIFKLISDKVGIASVKAYEIGQKSADFV